MSSTMRMTGLFSGLDTESIISALVSVKAMKVTTLEQEQEKLGWKQTIWQNLNSKVYSMYSGSLSNMRLTGSYSLKTTKVSDSTKATVTAADDAVNGSQKLEIVKLAQAKYITGANLTQTTTTTADDGTESTTTTTWTSSSKLSDINSYFSDSENIGAITLTFSSDSKNPKTIEVDDSTTISQFVTKLKEAGVNASFDETNQRFFVSSKSAGAENDFTLSGDGLKYLGLDLDNASYLGEDNKCTKLDAQDAEIVLNDATFTSTTNTFTINGLTITATATTDEAISISTETDYDGIYDMIKDMFSEYNDVINDIYTRYNADSARDYDMLTDEEKEAMTDDQIETWEDTIKASLLRRDNDLYTIMNALTSTMAAGYKDADGTTHYLSDYGIATLSYFEAEENERKAYHIDGDTDDEYTSTNTDKLKAAIASDPENTIQFFANLCNTMYDKISTIMTRSEYRSVYKIYDDKTLQSEYDDYTTQISEAEEELEDYEDRYYDKFSSMEVALSKLQSTQSTVSSMLGS